MPLKLVALPVHRVEGALMPPPPTCPETGPRFTWPGPNLNTAIMPPEARLLIAFAISGRCPLLVCPPAKDRNNLALGR